MRVCLGIELSIIIGQRIIIIIVKGSQNIFETKRPFGVDDDGNLLTYLMDTTNVAMDTVVNNW